MMDPAIWTDYARDALRILDRSVRLYRQGARESYRVAAAQLRLLLCDTNRVHERLVDISLAPRIFPYLTLHPAVITPHPEGTRIAFDRDRPPLPLADWLKQELPLPDGDAITLRELVRRVCEQDGGAHVDPRPLSRLRSWPDRAEVIVAVGEYIVEELGQRRGWM